MPIKQSFCYPCFKDDETTLDQLCAKAASLGYAGVELWFRGDEFDELVAAAKAHGLTIACMCGHETLTAGLNNRADHDRIEAEILASIDVAATVDIPSLICFSGNRNEGQSDADGADATAEGLSRVAPYAEQKGVTLIVELLNSKIDHAGYQCDSTAWGVGMCEKVGSPRVKLLYDIYHMQIMEGDVIRTIEANIDHIGHFHTAGVPGRRDLDDVQELYYPAICRAIAATGYGGYLAHEFTPKADRLEGLAAAFELCDV